jgi:hypothetical protein
LEWLGWHGNVEQRTRGIAMATTAPAARSGMNRWNGWRSMRDWNKCIHNICVDLKYNVISNISHSCFFFSFESNSILLCNNGLLKKIRYVMRVVPLFCGENTHIARLWCVSVAWLYE